MAISVICVGIVITVLCGAVCFVLGVFSDLNTDNGKVPLIVAWILASSGFGICLTMLLYQNGIIK